MMITQMLPPSLCSRWLKAESEYSAAEEKYLSRPEEERADQTSELNNKKSAKDNAASEYENEKNRVRSSLVSQLSSVEAEISDISFRISDYESQAGSESNMSYEAADADVTAKQRALEELMTAYNKTKKTNDITDQKAALDMEAQQKALDKQREKVEKLKKNSSEDKIVSKYSGVVSSVNVKPDEKVMAGTPMAVIDIADEGFTVKIPVDGEKTKKITKGK